MVPFFGVRASCRHGMGIGCHFGATLEEAPYEPKPAGASDPHGRKMPAFRANVFLIDLIEFLFSLLIGKLTHVGSGHRSPGKRRAPAASGRERFQGGCRALGFAPSLSSLGPGAGKHLTLAPARIIPSSFAFFTLKVFIVSSLPSSSAGKFSSFALLLCLYPPAELISPAF